MVRVMSPQGERRAKLSHTFSSLAYDVLKEQTEDLIREPELNLIIDKLINNNTGASLIPVRVGGRVTVSF